MWVCELMISVRPTSWPASLESSLAKTFNIMIFSNAILWWMSNFAWWYCSLSFSYSYYCQWPWIFFKVTAVSISWSSTLIKRPPSQWTILLFSHHFFWHSVLRISMQFHFSPRSSFFNSFLAGHEIYHVRRVLADDRLQGNSCSFGSSPFWLFPTSKGSNYHKLLLLTQHGLCASVW